MPALLMRLSTPPKLLTVYDCETEIYADVNLSTLNKSHMDFDVCGHYSRPDIFEFNVNSKAMKAVNFNG